MLVTEYCCYSIAAPSSSLGAWNYSILGMWRLAFLQKLRLCILTTPVERYEKSTQFLNVFYLMYFAGTSVGCVLL